MTKLSAHFSLAEMTVSTTASLKRITEQFDPPQSIIDNLTNLCQNLAEPMRAKLSEKLGKDTAIHVTSGYRCPALNTDIGGATKSQHLTGEAYDSVVK